MDTSRTYPKLRWPLEIKLEHIGDDELLLIRCPLGVSPEPLLLVAAVAPVVVALDGSLSFQQLLDKFSSVGLSEELLNQLIDVLDSKLFLANGRFFAAERQLKDDFSALDVRPPALAGLVYPATAGELAKLVDSFCENSPVALMRTAGSPVALVAPHIDYRRGGKCYGKIYPELSQMNVEILFLLGTSHKYSKSLFQFTRKSFATPLGVLSAERESINRIAYRFGEERSFVDEYLHKQEHSLELQVPFVQRFAPHAKLVPILVGSFHDMLPHGRLPSDFEEYESFVASLAEELTTLTAQGRRWGIVAGVDMAHIGRAFGDTGSLTPELLRDIANLDSEYLVALCAGDKNSLFQHVAKDQDARRICGFPTLYTVLDVFDRLALKTSGDVVDYSQAVDYTTDCAVTFAGVSLRATPQPL
jgi:AmmeMemoRadiSam system protein B